ncbi:Ubiquitin carboxyl-terminal hydrolase 4,Ubiquitin carboxyl-terminal hydrolase 15 [Mytilus coruscus]|uniref:Ubiquitin carboxyl-terminal hydrolase 4,Ubiquitin carboxyl-terminal hydrolase 15 n=1 Tax=Mytilus coruscus TaxID=42192 RepID=A0A6J8E8B3_MYTCO|nr:Ubiquitin carboxyl-terminal hydrolase 4,Ubiquitin carboxyl-terminal hydrolase 15 [Mytilus coruscus]
MATGGWDLASQKKEIRELLKTPLKKGDKWYLLATSWFKPWKVYVGYESWHAFNAGQQEAHPGPIDNLPLIDDYTGKLREHLIDELDYQLVPLNAWNILVSSYGLVDDQIPIERFVIEQGMFVKHCKVEVYLLELKMCQKQFQSEYVIRSMSRADVLELQIETITCIKKSMKSNVNSTINYGMIDSSTVVEDSVVISFDAYKDGKLVLTPYKPVSEEIYNEVLKQKKKVTNPDAASNTGDAKNTQIPTDGKLPFNSYCEPCFRGNKESVTFSWCCDCEETLCTVCDETHRINKVSMSHTAVAIEKISSTTPITVSSYVLCEIHPEISLEFYCSEHCLLCCRTCIQTVHRTCDIVSIEDVSKTAKQSALFEKVFIDVKELFHTTKQLKERHSKNLDGINQQEMEITNKIKQLKVVFDNHFEKLESKLKNEMKLRKQRAVSCVNRNENTVDKLFMTLEKHNANLKFVSDHGSNKHAFILANVLKPEIERKETELNELIALERKMDIELKTNVGALYLENAIKSLGTIEISETSIEFMNIRPSIAQSMKSNEEK